MEARSVVQYNQEFQDDFVHWHGRTCQGAFGHWCPDWDFLPIDEFCQECASCGCFANDPKYQQARDEMDEVLIELEEIHASEEW
jgi:hypothetical protein